MLRVGFGNSGVAGRFVEEWSMNPKPSNGQRPGNWGCVGLCSVLIGASLFCNVE